MVMLLDACPGDVFGERPGLPSLPDSSTLGSEASTMLPVETGRETASLPRSERAPVRRLPRAGSMVAASKDDAPRALAYQAGPRPSALDAKTGGERHAVRG